MIAIGLQYPMTHSRETNPTGIHASGRAWTQKARKKDQRCLQVPPRLGDRKVNCLTACTKGTDFSSSYYFIAFGFPGLTLRFLGKD